MNLSPFYMGVFDIILAPQESFPFAISHCLCIVHVGYEAIMLIEIL
jgi:hypothetical protein